MTGESWIEKHRPETFDAIQGNNKDLREIKQWAENWSPGDSPQLLVGEPGIGKTTAAYVTARYLGYPLNEINASSARKSADIAAMAKSMKSTPADAERQVVLLDEVDSWHHASDKKPLYEAIKDPQNPVFLTANEKYEVPDAIKRASVMREFSLGKRSIKAKLKEIAEREDIDLPDTHLARLSERSDLRSAINDLQTYAETGRSPGHDKRERDTNEFSAAESLLKHGTEWKMAASARDRSVKPDWLMMWADENLRNEFRGLEAGLAYDALSRADRWLWRRQKYAGAILQRLPELRLSEPYEGYINVDFPNFVRRSTDPAEALHESVDGRQFKFGGDEFYFRKRLVPILRGLPDETKYELILNEGIDDDGMEALGVDPSDYEGWAEDEVVEDPGPEIKSAADW